MPRPLRVFLCHASQDKPIVWKLHRYLKQHGVQPWLDQEDLLPGEDWEVEIPKALFASDVILVCLSKNSVNKEGFVQKEITFALDKAMEKPEGTIFIIPVKLEECEIPRRLTRYQWVDLSRTDGRKRLLMGLNKRVTEIGEEVTPVVMEDTRQRIPRPQPPKPEIRKPEEQIISIPVKEEIKEESKKEVITQIPSLPLGEERGETLISEAVSKPNGKIVQKKPFTKLLNPSSLSPKGTSHPQGGNSEKTEREAAEKVAREKKEQEVVKQYLNEKAERNRKRLVERATKEGKINESIDQAFSFFSRYSRQFSIGGIILLVLIFGGLGLNSLFNKSPVISVTPTSRTSTETSESPISTAVLFTPTLPSTQIPNLTPTPSLGIGLTMISEKDGMILVYVPAGTFTMGNDTSDQSDEKPEHQVDLGGFWIDQTEITNAMYAKCVTDGACKEPTNASSYTHSNYYGNSEFDDYPVLYVDWNMANAYCSWADRRLPTEAEWEKAARGTDGRTYPWGEDISCDKANYNAGIYCIGDATKVGSYESGKSIYGVYDMAGNVWEWVSSLYQPYPYDASDGRENLSSLASRVLRGGSWTLIGGGGRSADRLWSGPSDTSLNLGFRCSRSP